MDNWQKAYEFAKKNSGLLNTLTKTTDVLANFDSDDDSGHTSGYSGGFNPHNPPDKGGNSKPASDSGGDVGDLVDLFSDVVNTATN